MAKNILKPDSSLPPELQTTALERQLPAALGGIGMAATLGPIGLLAGVAAGLLARRQHRQGIEQWRGFQEGVRQLNEEFQARAEMLREQFAARAEAGDESAIRDIQQLEELQARHAAGLKLAMNASPELSNFGLQILSETNGGIGRWLEDVESREEALRDQESQALRAEVSALESSLRAIDESITRIDDRFNRAAAIWNETSNRGQQRAVFDDFMGQMLEDFGTATVATGVATALGAGLGALIPGVGTILGLGGGAAAGNVAGQIISALSREDVKFSPEQMLRIMNAVHQEAKKSATAELNSRFQQWITANDRLQRLNRFRQTPEESELIRARGPTRTMRTPTPEPLAIPLRERIRQFGLRPTEETP